METETPGTTDQQPAPARTDAVPAAKAPLGTGASPLVAQLCALLLVGLGAVGGQDLLARTGLVAQDPWLDTALGAVDGLESGTPWVLLAGVAALLVGLVLLGVSLRRRPRRTVELRAATGVRLRRRDLAHVVRAHLEGTNGVTELDVRASARSVRITAHSVAGSIRGEDVRAALQQRLDDATEPVDRRLRSRIRVKEIAA